MSSSGPLEPPPGGVPMGSLALGAPLLTVAPVPILPASTAYPIGQRISASGAPYSDTLVLLAQDTGLPWRLVIRGGAIVLEGIPSCADIAAGFATCEALATAVPSCASLVAWGF